jgi:hypothetical protein
MLHDVLLALQGFGSDASTNHLQKGHSSPGGERSVLQHRLGQVAAEVDRIHSCFCALKEFVESSLYSAGSVLVHSF